MTRLRNRVAKLIDDRLAHRHAGGGKNYLPDRATQAGKYHCGANNAGSANNSYPLLIHRTNPLPDGVLCQPCLGKNTKFFLKVQAMGSHGLGADV